MRELATNAFTHLRRNAALYPVAALTIWLCQRLFFAWFVDGVDLITRDPMQVSGFATVIVGVWLSLGAERRFRGMVDRLVDRQALVIESGELMAFRQGVEHQVHATARRWAVLITSAIGFGYIFFYYDVWSWIWGADYWRGFLEFTAASLFAGYVAGGRLGRLVGYGAIGRFLERRQTIVIAEPGHPDGAAGLRPYGDYFFFQAMLVSLPILWLGLWWVFIPDFPGYHEW